MNKLLRSQLPMILLMPCSCPHSRPAAQDTMSTDDWSVPRLRRIPADRRTGRSLAVREVAIAVLNWRRACHLRRRHARAAGDRIQPLRNVSAK